MCWCLGSLILKMQNNIQLFVIWRLYDFEGMMNCDSFIRGLSNQCLVDELLCSIWMDEIRFVGVVFDKCS